MLLGYFVGNGEQNRQIAAEAGTEVVRALGRLGVALPLATFGGGAVGLACSGVARGEAAASGGALSGRVLGGFDLLARLAGASAEALQDERADGQFSVAWYDAPRGQLTLAHDPFGAGRLYYAQFDGVCWFADDLRALLALAPVRARRALDLRGLHRYLAFSFVAAPRTLLRGVASVPPNTALTFAAPEAAPGVMRFLSPPATDEAARPTPDDEATWGTRWWAEFDGALGRWSAGVDEAAVHLSGGLDSALVAAWLARSGRRVRLLHLDFGPPYDAERPYAEATANWLGVPLERIPVSPRRFGAGRLLRQVAADLGEPWGDPVTLPLHHGYRAAREAGLPIVFNGEGGDQLFAGWPNRPMLAGELYADPGDAEADRADRYLRTFHHFYGLEEATYGPALLTAAHDDDLATLVRPYLAEPALPHLLDRLRWANYWLKGGQNILPRAAALGRRAGVAMAAPFFDRRLARFALTIPPGLLLRGTEEKALIKRVVGARGLLPPAVLARPKRGMGVPATAWAAGPLRGTLRGLLRRLARRDLLRLDYLRSLARGEPLPGEVRGARRVGEQIWQLAMLEAWLEVFYD